MDVLKIFVLVCIFGMTKSAGTSTDMVPRKGPCPGIEYRTRFNILSYFPFLFDVENEIYCVDNEGNEVDCELSCPQPLCDIHERCRHSFYSSNLCLYQTEADTGEFCA